MCESGGKWTLWGVTSWGYGCAQPNFPGIYARVSEYTNWINNLMRNNSKNVAVFERILRCWRRAEGHVLDDEMTLNTDLYDKNDP